MLLIFANRCINIYIKVDESGVKGWKVDKVDNFVDTKTPNTNQKEGVFDGARI